MRRRVNQSVEKQAEDEKIRTNIQLHKLEVQVREALVELKMSRQMNSYHQLSLF